MRCPSAKHYTQIQMIQFQMVFLITFERPCFLIMFISYVLEGDYDDGEEEGEYCLANAEAGGELGENGMFFYFKMNVKCTQNQLLL